MIYSPGHTVANPPPGQYAGRAHFQEWTMLLLLLARLVSTQQLLPCVQGQDKNSSKDDEDLLARPRRSLRPLLRNLRR